MQSDDEAVCVFLQVLVPLFNRDAQAGCAVTIGEAGTAQGVSVEFDGLWAAASFSRMINHFNVAASEVDARGETIEFWGYTRIDDELVLRQPEPEETLHNQVYGESRAAGIDAPATFERDITAQCFVVFGKCLIAIRKGGVGAGIVAVRLAWCSGRNELAHGDRIDLAEGAKKLGGVAMMGEGLGVADVGMGIHVANFPSEVARAFGALEVFQYAPMIGHGLVE